MNKQDRRTTEAMVEFEPIGCIRLALDVDCIFLLHWVRRTSMYDVVGDLGTRLPVPGPTRLKIAIEADLRMVKSVDSEGRLRLRVYLHQDARKRKVVVSATPVTPAVAYLDPLLDALLQLPKVRETVLGMVPESLKAQYTAQCNEILDETHLNQPLIDASFAVTEKGLEAWMKAVAGDFTSLSNSGADFQLNQGALTSQLEREASIELFLPQLDRKDWKLPAVALAKAAVCCNTSGQIFLGWHNDRVIENNLRLAGYAAAHNGASLDTATVSHGTCHVRQIPASYLTSWFEAPGDRQHTYGLAYGQIALSVQRLLREELPRIWFSDPENYAKVIDSHAILVYAASRPFLGRTRTEFSYEFQNPVSMRRFFRSANQALPAALERIQTVLGDSELARHYKPTYSRDIVGEVSRREHNLHRIMAAESTIIECFIQAGMEGHEFRFRMATQPRLTAEGIANYAARFAGSLVYRTKRIHQTVDFGDLALPLLMEASSALNNVLRGDSKVTRRRAA